MKKMTLSTVIFTLFTTPMFSVADDFSQLENWHLEVSNYEYMADSFDKVVAQNNNYFVVYQNAGISCPAGSHWLFNKEEKSYKSIYSGTCDDQDFKVILNSEHLIFMSGNTLTAKYPIY